MIVVFKPDTCWFEPPGPLNVDRFGTIYHHFSDGIICQERLDGTITQNFGDDLLQQFLAISPGQEHTFLGENGIEHLFDLPPHFVGLINIYCGIKFGQQSIMNAVFQVPKCIPCRCCSNTAHAQVLEPRGALGLGWLLLGG